MDVRGDSDHELRTSPVRLSHGDHGQPLIILDFAARELQSIAEFQSSRAASAELAAGVGEAHVHFVEIAAGGEIGPHVAGFGQLFVCLAGEGWVASANDERVPLGSGQAAYFARGERHSKGSQTGLHALIVQVRDLELLTREETRS